MKFKVGDICKVIKDKYYFNRNLIADGKIKLGDRVEIIRIQEEHYIVNFLDKDSTEGWFGYGEVINYMSEEERKKYLHIQFSIEEALEICIENRIERVINEI